MEKETKKKFSAVAIATAVILILAGTMAFLADASGTLRNTMGREHLEVFITEDSISGDNGDKDYTVKPGTSADKDPTISVVTDTDAYLYLVVKDTLNSHELDGQKVTFAEYTIDDGWEPLNVSGLTEKDIEKFVNVFEEENKSKGTLHVDPRDSNTTKIYYRVVHGDGSKESYNVLKNDQIHYPGTLSNKQLAVLDGIESKEDKALIFQTYAVTMDPFCPEDEVSGADPATADQKQYAKDAWNETKVVPTAVTVSQEEEKTTVEIGKTLPLTATVTPKNAVDKTVTWTSSDPSIATVDSNGVVTGVAIGTVTITATATAGNNVTDTYEVTVEPALSFGYAVQFHGYDTNTSTVTFWPAMGPKAQGAITQGVSHNDDAAGCIHHDSWSDIKTNLANNPNYYDACKTNGCTKKVVLDEDAFNSDQCGVAIKTAGDGGGFLFDGLTYEEAMWEKSGNNKVDRPSYKDTLEKIKSNSSNLPASATMFLLGKAELESAKPNAADRVIYENSGDADWWWLADPSSYNGRAYNVHSSGSIESIGGIVSCYGGIAPGFSY